MQAAAHNDCAALSHGETLRGPRPIAQAVQKTASQADASTSTRLPRIRNSNGRSIALSESARQLDAGFFPSGSWRGSLRKRMGPFGPHSPGERSAHGPETFIPLYRSTGRLLRGHQNDTTTANAHSVYRCGCCSICFRDRAARSPRLVGSVGDWADETVDPVHADAQEQKETWRRRRTASPGPDFRSVRNIAPEGRPLRAAQSEPSAGSFRRLGKVG